MFINRTSELQQLDRLYHSQKAELFVLYGRRRVGKTELLREFCRNKPHIFFIATLSSDNDQLASFSQLIWGFGHAQVPEGFTFPSWEAAFRSLADIDGRPIIILDEFTYLISGNKAIPSILQKVWDETLKDSNLLLILCGSYIGMMETEVLGYQAALYGRRTSEKLLQPLDLPSSALFFPGYSPAEQFVAWGVLGGMPYYLQNFSDRDTIAQNIRFQILDAQQSPLYNEPRLLLMEELREPRNYFSILRAIAQGHTRSNEISQFSGVGPVTVTARYLDILQQMRLVTRRVPVTESQPEKSKKGMYQVDDHFLRFWFRYVHPNLGSLDLGLADVILQQKVLPDLDHFLAAAFEEASRGYLAALARSGKLPFLPERIGSWWDRDVEIDVVAINESDGKILLGESKWSKHPVGINVCEELKQKAKAIQENGRWQEVRFALFSRTGFSQALIERSQEEEILLASVNEMIRPQG